jgi:hypothetical protein
MAHDPVPEGEAPRWLDDPANRNRVFQATAAAWVAFMVAGLLPYERHPYFAVEQLPGFAGLYGLTAFIGLVLAATWMRTWLERPEDYYDDE